MPNIGDSIANKYKLERLLGAGGMGSVFLATHVEIGKKVAIKFLKPTEATDATDVERFRREARAAAAAGHHNIVDIFDIGVDDEGSQYLVMEALEGRSLGDEIVASGPLDEALIAYIACQVLSALDATHSAGVVHRDLKPDNIFLVDTGAPLPDVKLLDFGISHVTDLAGSSTGKRHRLTKTGTVMGSPYYMSPEQAMGKSDIDHLTDIYSMGVILYEAATGQDLYVAENYNQLLAAIITSDPVEPTFHRPELSSEFEKVIERALRKEKYERFADAAEMFDALMPFVSVGAVDRISRPKKLIERDSIPTPGQQAPTVEDISLQDTIAREEERGPAQSSQRVEPAAPTIPPRAVTKTEGPESDAKLNPSVSRRRVWRLSNGVVVLLVAIGGVSLGIGLSSDPENSPPVFDAGADPSRNDANHSESSHISGLGDAASPIEAQDAATTEVFDEAVVAEPDASPTVEPRSPLPRRRPPRHRTKAGRDPVVSPLTKRPDEGTYVPETPSGGQDGATHVD